MAVKFLTGDSIQQTVQLSSQNIIHKGEILMWNAGHVERASSSLGLIDQAFAGFYEGPELSTSRTGADDYKIQIRVPTGRFTFEADTSGTVSTSTIGVQYGIATSEVSSGVSTIIGVANVDYGNFVHIGNTNSSGRNIFMGLAGTIASTT